MSGEPIKTLLIEDNPGDARLIREMLKEIGAAQLELAHVERLDEGLKYLGEEAVEVMLLDLGLPDSQGLDTLARAQAQVPEVPIVVLTSLADEMVGVEAVRGGAQDYLVKSQVDGNLLVRALRYAIERKRAEEALRESETRYRVLVEQIPAVTYIAALDETSTTLYFSPQIETILGFSQAEWTTEPDLFLKRLHPDDHERVVAELAHSQASGEPFISEYRLLSCDGSVVWFRDEAAVVRDEAGNLLFLQGVMIDITERKRAEEALRESEQKFRSVVEQSHDGIVLVDEQGVIVEWNRGLEQITGLKRANVLGRPIWEVNYRALSEEQKASVVYDQYKALMLESLRTGQAPWLNRLMETEIQRPDGTCQTVQQSTFSIKTEKGFMLGSVLRDIAERKRAEEVLERRMKQLTALNRASQAVTASLEMEQVLAEIVSLAGEVTGSDHTGVATADKEGNLIQSSEIGLDVLDLVQRARPEGYTDWIIRSRQAVIINDVAEDGTVISQEPQGAPRTLNPHLAKTGIRSAAGLPLVARDRLLGVLCLHSLRPHHFRGQLPLLSTFANQAATAIENARLYEEATRRARYLATLNEVNQALTSTLDLDRVLSLLLSLGREMLDAEASSVALVDESTGDLVFKQAVGEASEPVIGLRLKPGEGIVGQVVAHGKAVLVADAHSDPRFYGDVKGEDFTTRDLLCAPLIAQDRVIGAIEVLNKRNGVFSEKDLDLLESIAAQAAVAVGNAQLLDAVTRHRRNLQSLSTRLINAQEAERKRISQELHDEMGQSLTGLKLVLEMISRSSPESVKAGLDEARALVNQLLAQVRELSLNLRPAMLDDLGLVPALLWHLERYTAQTNVRVAFLHGGLEDRRFAPQVETAAYRIVQEALTNVARHAGVSEATVRLWVQEETLSMQIEDQGVGFDPRAVLAAGTTSGLTGMHERVVLLSGRLTIESTPGAGTRLTAELPLGNPVEPGRGREDGYDDHRTGG